MSHQLLYKESTPQLCALGTALNTASRYPQEDAIQAVPKLLSQSLSKQEFLKDLSWVPRMKMSLFPSDMLGYLSLTLQDNDFSPTMHADLIRRGNSSLNVPFL